MPRLRLIKERQSDNHDFVPDLRNLGDPGLFSDNHISINLLVQFPPSEQIISELCSAYSLDASHDRNHHELKLNTKHEHEHNHKIQALILYFVAMEICHHSAHSSCHIYQTNGLHALLHKRIKNSELVHSHKHTNSTLSLDANVSFYLNHVGITIQDSSELAKAA